MNYRNLNESEKLEIDCQFGTYWRANATVDQKDIYFHPKHLPTFSIRDPQKNRELDPSLDVALLKLKSPVPIEKFNDSLYYYAKMICLPPNDITPTKEEYVFASGWGEGHENHLKIGTRILKAELTRGIVNINHTFHSLSIVENGKHLTQRSWPGMKKFAFFLLNF